MLVAELLLQGAGEEPVDFVRTIASHGVAELPRSECSRTSSRRDERSYEHRLEWVSLTQSANYRGFCKCTSSGSSS